MITDQARLDDLLSRVRRFVNDVAIPNEDRVEREDLVGPDLVAEMRKLGTFGWSIPREYGGSELSTEELALAFMELTQCSVAYRVVGAQNAGIGSECLIRDGTPAQKQRYLPRLATGELLGCLALTEETAGSDATALKTRATQVVGGDYVLNGAKRYITLAPIAGLFTVLARTDEAPRGAAGISAFLIERGTPGLTTSGSTPKMGQEGAPIGEVYLQDCRVPADQIIGLEPGRGFATVMKCLNKQRVNLAALSTGPAIRMLDEGVRYARERQQSGRPIGEFQLVQAMLAECKVEIEATRALILETARKRDRGEDVTMDVSLCKYLATEMCCRVADRIVQVFGGQGYVKGRGIERFYRDVRAARIYEGTSQIHLLNIAKHLLKGA
ncbi:MAG: acyl-CoA dehydrogenase family protein [Proteobacteria bacterium]|nr:acyl-CoA dehydrogenase family protein [Pseudomonadota bacterium]